ncbi:MAG TPA: potassium transporter Kup [Gemmatimonadaceae bacterium]|nr:potassium transporter Kup [Gemmatimonadaceae bacterium]
MPADQASPQLPPDMDPMPNVGATAARPIPRERPHVEANPTGTRLAVLTVTAIGVVYGDIGTSPLYALREAFKPEYGLTPVPYNVYGVLSLFTWALMLVVSLKYILYVMRCDNSGEGGILAMLALIMHTRTVHRQRRAVLVALGLIGAALLYGDGVITPAITVLGAMEGLLVVSPGFEHLIIPATLVVLIVLFAFQRFGTAKVGAAFGPMMILWFGAIAALGAIELVKAPHVLAALNPWYAMQFMYQRGWSAFLLLGAVVLAVTGAEALYADMGHFGKRPIRLAWFWLVFPCLLLNYFGQGALILRDPTAVANPFYRLAPAVLLYPLIAVATIAAIIASQALISGAFSLTHQAVQLGYSPRVTIVHTSAREAGQIYIPEVNYALMVSCLIVVLGFKNSSALGAAYGIAVTGTMAITSVLFVVVAATRWKWSIWRALALGAAFLVVDLAFLGANALKIANGGWVPLVIAAVLFTLMTTWKRGRAILGERLREITLPLDTFLDTLHESSIPRVRGAAVFMTPESGGAPVVLLHHLKHNKVLHEKVILLSIETAGVPEVRNDERLAVERKGHGFVRVVARYGFMESPDVKEIMELLRRQGVRSRPLETSYYLGRELLIPLKKRRRTGGLTMNIWRKQLFALMSKNAKSAAEFFQLPPNRVVELGTQIEF